MTSAPKADARHCLLDCHFIMSKTARKKIELINFHVLFEWEQKWQGIQ